MKTLFLLRHAKSSWSNPGLRDFDRPLNGRGRKAAKAMGAFMAEKGLKPALIYSSSSARTRETVARFEKGFGEKLDVQFMDDLYHSSSGLMLNLAQNTSDDIQSLMLVAHNPGMQDAALGFIGEADEKDIFRLDYKYPTAALAQFAFEVGSWARVGFGQGALQRLVYPRDL